MSMGRIPIIHVAYPRFKRNAMDKNTKADTLSTTTPTATTPIPISSDPYFDSYHQTYKKEQLSTFRPFWNYNYALAMYLPYINMSYLQPENKESIII